MTPPADFVSEFRRFNRLYTQFLGTLREGYHDSPFTLTEARILFEVASRNEPTAAVLCGALDLDPGYLSRTLRSLGKRRLIKQAPSKRDRRSRVLTLTDTGRAGFSELNRKSDEQAHALLRTMNPEAEGAFISSLRTVRRAIAPEEALEPVVLRPHRPGDLGWVIHREGELYAREFGWDGSFEGLVAGIVSDFAKHFDPVRERCWMAEIAGERVGHIFLVKDPSNPSHAKLRLLLVEPSARGRGVGRALVQECVRFARSSGYTRISLWTQSILKAAHRLYEEAGFTLASEEPHHSFGKDLTGQTWELDLRPAAPP